MKKYFKIGFLVLLAIFVLIQFIRPTKNKAEGIQANNIKKLVTIDATVDKILTKACYDCHSNNTNYPWYAKIMPVGWLLSNHVKEGKQHFNFDEFATYKPKKALHKLEEIDETVTDGSMPQKGYTFMHKDAKLTPEEKNTLTQWAKNAQISLKAKFAVDSATMSVENVSTKK
jgi:Haem-binding domain